MAFLPYLENNQTYRDYQMEFKGYNHSDSPGDQEFYETKNLTLGHYPVLAPRAKRGRVRAFTKFNGLHDKDGLLWVDGTGLYHHGQKVGDVSDSKKKFVTMGARVLIWPDKVMYDTEKEEIVPLGKSLTLTGATFALSKIDGELYGEITASDTAPLEPENGAYWIDTSSDVHSLKIYSSATGMWTSIGVTYVKISHPSLANEFAQYDGIRIEGVDNAQFTNAGTDYVVISTGYGWIVVIGIIDAGFTVEGQITISRRVPDMDYLVQSENRVWGCSSENHEIYACKQGDPTNWYCYQGLSTDSYAATIGSDGEFTGAAAHLGYVLFFKQNCVHKVFGSRPANYQITESQIRGIKTQAHESAKIVNETLYYLAPGGMVRYDGSLPTNIGEALGPTRRFFDAIAGVLDNRYYVSMKDDAGEWGFYVFDERTNMWIHEDQTHAQAILASGDDLYFVDQAGVLWSENGTLDSRYTDSNAALEGPVEWMAETGDILMNSPDKGYISRIELRLEVEKDGYVEVAVMHDSDGKWHPRDRIYATRKRLISLQAIPLRCDHFRIRLSGKGNCKIYALSKTMEGGTEL